MERINKELIIIIALVVFALWVLYPFFENFDATTSEFVPYGADRYGLRGNLLHRRSIKDFYIRPDRRVRLSLSGGDMWESNYSPSEVGIKDCRQVKCPEQGYDNIDVCFQCGSNCPNKMRIPDIPPH